MAKETVLQDGGAHRPSHHESPLERQERLERSLESGLEGTFPGSDAISVVQPPPSIFDRKAKGGRTKD